MEKEITAEEYVRQLTFKHKIFGGCDEEDVLLKIRELCDIYKKEVDSLEERLEDTAQGDRNSRKLKQRYRELQQRNSELEQENSDLEEENQQLEQQLQEVKGDSLQRAAQAQLKANNDGGSGGEAYAQKIKQLENLMNSIEASKRDILRKTKWEAMQEAEKLKKETQELQQQKDALTEEVKSCSFMLDSELEQLQTGLEGLRRNARKLSDPYALETK